MINHLVCANHVVPDASTLPSHIFWCTSGARMCFKGAPDYASLLKSWLVGKARTIGGQGPDDWCNLPSALFVPTYSTQLAACCWISHSLRPSATE
jgi:hypothetical protein